MSADRTGTELAGYAIRAEIGRGGMGIVYRADQLGRNGVPRRAVALKVLDPVHHGDDEFRQRFLRETEIAMAIEHPNVIPIYDAGEDGGVLYLAMRYVDGLDLGRLLELEGPFGPGRALDLLDHVARALDAAHAKGLVHRDVKPGNILIGAASHGDESVYLTDFGLTKRTSTKNALTRAGVFMGTPAYAAPEQFQGGTVDRRADVYALACVLYECLTAVQPYQRDSDVAMMFAHMQDPVPALRAVRPELPVALEQVLARAMAKDPTERYDTCRALIAAARAAVRGAVTEAGPPPGPVTPVTPTAERLTPPAPISPPGQVVGGWAPPPGPPAPPAWGPPVPPPPRRGARRGLVVALALVGLVLLTGTGIGIWALVKPDTGKEPPGPVAGGPTTTEDPTGTTTETTTGETGQTPAERVRAYFGPVNNSGCAEVAAADRLVAGAPVEIRCKPDSQGVDVSYVYFGTKKVMDDYTKFLQGRPDDIRISIDSPWEYTSPKGDVGYKISYYHPGVDESYIYWTYQDDLMGVIASRKGKDEATLEKWWLDVDILRHD